MQLHHQQLFHLPAMSRLLEAQQQRQRLKALALLVKANQLLSPQKKARQQKQASQRLQRRVPSSSSEESSTPSSSAPPASSSEPATSGADAANDLEHTPSSSTSASGNR